MKLFVPLILLISSVSFTSFAGSSEEVNSEEQTWSDDCDDGDSSLDNCDTLGEEDYCGDEFYPETTRTKTRYWYQPGFQCQRTHEFPLNKLAKEFAASRRDNGSRRAAKVEKCLKGYLKRQRDLKNQPTIMPVGELSSKDKFEVPDYLEEHAMNNPNPCPKRSIKHQRDPASEFRNF